MNRKIIFFVCFCLSTITCKQGSDSTMAQMNSPQLQVLSRALSQTPGTNGVSGTIQQLNFKLYKIQVISEHRQIYTVYREKQEIDLIALKTDNLMELFKSELPSGRYCEVRMFLGRTGTAVISDKSYPISLKDKPEMRHPWEWGRKKGHKYYSKPDKPSDNPCFLPRITHDSRKKRGFKNKDFSDFDYFASSDSDDFELDSSFGQPYWRWGRHWLHSHSLYHLRRGFSVVRMKSAFELAAGRIYTMTINFDPSQSVYKEFGRYYLDPDIELTSSTLINGPFNVSGLIQDETVVTELSADGSMRMLTTLHPRAELHGVYFFNQATHVLHFTPTDVVCDTCNVDEIPIESFYDFPNSDISVSNWSETGITGSVDVGGIVKPVSFAKTGAFAIDTSTGYTVLHVVATYPAGYNGKFSVLSLAPKDREGRSYVDVQSISNYQATFYFKIPYKELPGGLPNGSGTYLATPVVASELSDLKINAQSTGAVCGNVSVSATNYTMTVPVADKVLTTNIAFTP